MGYAIYFLHTPHPRVDLIREYLGRKNHAHRDIQQIEPSLQELLTQTLEEKGISFKVFEDNEGVRLDVSRYQVHFFEREILLNLTYGDSPSLEDHWEELESLIKLLMEHGLTAFDPQIDVLINSPEELKKNFAQQQKTVEKIMGERPLLDGAALRKLGLLALLIGLAWLIWQFT